MSRYVALVGRFIGFVVGGIEAFTLEHNTNRPDQTMNATVAFRADLDWLFIEVLHALKPDATLIALVFVPGHRDLPTYTIFPLPILFYRTKD
jgi:hypothetical protein